MSVQYIEVSRLRLGTQVLDCASDDTELTVISLNNGTIKLLIPTEALMLLLANVIDKQIAPNK